MSIINTLVATSTKCQITQTTAYRDGNCGGLQLFGLLYPDELYFQKRT